jgi:hypothetical protein
MYLADDNRLSTQLFRFCDRIRGGVGIHSIHIRAHLGTSKKARETGEYHFIEWREPSAKPEPSRPFPALLSIHIEMPGGRVVPKTDGAQPAEMKSSPRLMC